MEPRHTIPEYILPAHKRPTHYRPDLIRAVGYTFGPNGKLIKDPTYQGGRQLQLIECKYSMDGNMQEIINLIHNIYEPLKQALQHHGTLKADITIIPIVISRTIEHSTTKPLQKSPNSSPSKRNRQTHLLRNNSLCLQKKLPWRSTSTPKNGSHICHISQGRSSQQNRRPNTKQQALGIEHS